MSATSVHVNSITQSVLLFVAMLKAVFKVARISLVDYNRECSVAPIGSDVERCRSCNETSCLLDVKLRIAVAPDDC